MDPQDPSQRPSIFKTPEPRDEGRAPEPREERRQPAQEPASDFWADRPGGLRPAGREPLAESGPSRRLVMGLAFGGALLLLLIGGFVVSSLLRPNDGLVGATSPSGTPSPTARSSTDPTPTLEPTATPSPTPEPTPAGPPQEVPVGAWATVAVEELNVRSTAGTDATSNYILVKGSVVQVAEGPTVVADLNWYRVASLGGAVGWVTSGWVAEPFLTTLVEDPTLIRCGEVGHAVFDIVNGAPTPHDPIAIGELALPAAAFSVESLAAIELIRGVGGEACFSAQVGSDGVPVVSAQLSVGACGHAVADGSFFRLRPAAGQNVPVEAQVKDPAIVHPTVLVGGPPDNRKSSNLRTLLTMMANPDATGCVHMNITEDAGGVEVSRGADVTQCSIVSEYNADNLRLRPAAGGETAWIKLTSHTPYPGALPLGEAILVSINVSSYEETQEAYAYQGYPPGCE
jgi:uncharacterized protein YgiM (DUF1202 family)